MTTDAVTPKKRPSKAIKFAFGLAVDLFDWLMDSVQLLVVIGIVGGALTFFGPYLLNAPEVIGRLLASWCIDRGSCDLTTNLTSIGLGVYLLVAMFLLIMSGVFSSMTRKQSIYYDVIGELKRAGPTGVEPMRIAKRTGHDVVDVHTMLGFLFDDRRAEIVETDKAAGRHVKYRLAKDTDE